VLPGNFALAPGPRGAQCLVAGLRLDGDKWPKGTAGRLQYRPRSVIVSVRGSITILSCEVVWSSVVPGDLQTKLEKYERKAAQYEKAAEQANDGPERALYEGLASYCDELAEKFRQVIAKRTGASQAAE